MVNGWRFAAAAAMFTITHQSRSKMRKIWPDKFDMLEKDEIAVYYKDKEISMSEIVLQISDDVGLDKIITLLAPYIDKAKVKEAQGKVWTGKADWLKNPFKVDSFTPLTREEAHARKSLH
jgi:hypothetical protein